VEGKGEDYAEGRQPAAASQPGGRAYYHDLRANDLTTERVSPARRARIERYFDNLRGRKSALTTSRPASQPASQTTQRVPRP
jgi:hypothetical protein